MSFFRDIKKQFKSVAVSVFGVSVTVYFAFHIFQGERGLLAWWKLQKQVSKARTTAEVTSFQKTYLEKRVRLLAPDNLDPDMLEERARLMLNYGHADEIVILDPERKKQ